MHSVTTRFIPLCFALLAGCGFTDKAREKPPDLGPRDGPQDASADGVPIAWICEDKWYIDATCDCGCGAPDPICFGEGCSAVGCCMPASCAGLGCAYCANAGGDTAELCGFSEPPVDGPADGVTDAPPDGVPAAWVCDDAWYGDGGVCDCGCGAPDPDCLGDGCETVDCCMPASCASLGCFNCGAARDACAFPDGAVD